MDNGQTTVDQFGNLVINQPYRTGEGVYNLQGQRIGDAQFNLPQAMPQIKASQFLNEQANFIEPTNPSLANQFRVLANESDAIGGTQRKISDFFGGLQEATEGDLRKYQDVNARIGESITKQIQEQRANIESTFGPQGTQTQKVNEFFTGLGNFLATESARNRAKIESEGIQSGASLGAIRASQNIQAQEELGKFLQAKEQETNQMQGLSQVLNDYITNLRREFGETQDRYIIGVLDRAQQYRNKLNTALLDSNIQLELLRAQKALTQPAPQSITIPEGPQQTEIPPDVLATITKLEDMVDLPKEQNKYIPLDPVKYQTDG